MTARQICVVVGALLLTRFVTARMYGDLYYFYGEVSSQFGIAEAAFRGKPFAIDLERWGAAMREAAAQQRLVPIEEWGRYHTAGAYSVFPAVDLPGYGYLIGYTSRWFGGRLTSRYAFGVQVVAEVVAVMLFVWCAALVLGARVGFTAGLLYVFAYPFIWPMASIPLRDIFAMVAYSLTTGAFFAFIRIRNAMWVVVVVALFVLTGLVSWVRPSAYYYCFLVGAVGLLVRDVSRSRRLSFLALACVIPWLTFGRPYRAFNIVHYGVADTDVIGRGMWEGMGIIENNPYGFVLNDKALVPWLKAQGHDVEYASPEMNRLLAEHARSIIVQDPLYYLKTVMSRVGEIAAQPLELVPPRGVHPVGYRESGLTLPEYIRSFPLSLLYWQMARALSKGIFYGGCLGAILLFVRLRERRIEVAALLLPVVYTLAIFVPIHFEPRFLAPAAWVLLLPIAWFLDAAVRHRSISTSPSAAGCRESVLNTYRSASTSPPVPRASWNGTRRQNTGDAAKNQT